MEVKRIIIVTVLLSELVVWTLCDEHGCYECEQVLNRVSPTDQCPITMDDCGQCLDGYVMDTRNITCFPFGWIQRPCAVVGVAVGDSVNLIYTFNAEVSCVFLINGRVVVEDARHVLSVRGYPRAPSNCLDCTLTLTNVSHEDLGDYVVQLDHLTAFSTFTRHTPSLTIQLKVIGQPDVCNLEGRYTGGEGELGVTGVYVRLTMVCFFLAIVIFGVLFCVLSRERLCSGVQKRLRLQPTSVRWRLRWRTRQACVQLDRKTDAIPNVTLVSWESPKCFP